MEFRFPPWRKRKPRAASPCGQQSAASGYVAPQNAVELLDRYGKGERLFPGLTFPNNTSLRGASLEGLIAPNAVLRGVDLTGAVLKSANFEGADFEGCQLTGADLSSACLREGKLRKAVFHGSGSDQFTRPASLVGADLQSAKVHGADFRDCNLQDAVFYAVDGKEDPVRFDHADLRNVSFGNALLPSAMFLGADLTGADLTGANLTSADYRHALGGRFNETHTERLAFASTRRGFLFASPLWLQLRSAYTGVWMIVHLALLTIFVLPHAGEAVMWRAGSALQQFGRRALSDSALIPFVPRDTGSTLSSDVRRLRDSLAQDAAVRVKRALVDSGVPRGLCLDRDTADCRPQAIWQVLIGWNESRWVMVGLILAYFANLLRLVLTLAITSKRDSEAMSGISPSAGFVRVMGVGHWIFRVLVIYVAGTALITIVNFLQQPVWLRQ